MRNSREDSVIKMSREKKEIMCTPMYIDKKMSR